MQHAIVLKKNPSSSWKLPFSANELRCVIAAMLEAAGSSAAGLELSILDDCSMAALHKQSLGCTGPTNVLSFPADSRGLPTGAAANPQAKEEGRSIFFIGWLALSADTLLRECLLYGQKREDHCIRLLAHGLAHLLGHDHGPAMDALSARLEQAAFFRIRQKQC